MPDSPELDLSELRIKAKEVSSNFGAELLDRDVIEPVAFGLKALKLMFILDESKGSEDLSNELAAIEGVSSTEVVDMRRTVG